MFYYTWIPVEVLNFIIIGISFIIINDHLSTDDLNFLTVITSHFTAYGVVVNC